jgi:ABC-type uncharacterized transport system auxiliary subunit
MNRPEDTTRNRGHLRAAARLAVVLMVAAMLAGCGKEGMPVPPPDQPNTYPRPYPGA